jgi:large subunit ribosomal protein L5
MSLINVKENYSAQIKPLQEKLDIKNVMALPRLEKVSINVGLGQQRQNKDMVAYIKKSLEQIAGQKIVETHARKAIAGFKIREGDLVGLRVTLRNEKMYDFLNRLINITLPRIRDFRGIDPAKFDKQGNLTIGFKDQLSFVELGHDAIDRQFGLTITLTIKPSDPDKSSELLSALGFPIKKG